MQRARGVFMWARLVVDRALGLDYTGYGLRKIEAEIHSIPPELDTLYHELIRTMGSTSLKLIQWICFATRPLSMDELRWAMVIDADCSHRSLRACQSGADYISDNDRMKKQIQTLSCGLAEVTPSSHDQVAQFTHQFDQYYQDYFVKPSSHGQVVQFIHQSVQDFFVEKGLLALGSSSKSTDAAIGYAHFRLSRICIRYLAMEEIGQSRSHERGGMMSDFPFLRYATTSWVAHVKQSDSRSMPQDDLMKLFSWPSDALVALWAHLYSIMDEHSFDCPSQGTTLVHVASRYQVVGLLRAILRRADQMGAGIDTRDYQGRAPLLFAAENGHEAVVKLLLGTGKVDIDSNSSWGQTPLSFAADNGHEAVVKLLLGMGKVDIEAIGKPFLDMDEVNASKNWGQTARLDVRRKTGKRFNRSMKIIRAIGG